MASDFAHSGRRRAVIIGIEYKHTPFTLTRSATDLRRISAFLRNDLGVESSNMVALSDFELGQSDVRHQQPTRYNILNAMRWLSYGAQNGDSLFFYYAGQGTQVKDENGDELDSLDEAIVPADFQKAGLILDDEIHQVLVAPLPAQVRLTAVVDSPHSGSLFDLTYVIDPDGRGGVLRDKPAPAPKRRPTLSSFRMYNWLVRRRNRRTEAEAEVLLFASGKDYQSCATEFDETNDTGALTDAFLKVLQERNEELTYRRLLDGIRSRMSDAGHVQIVQVSTSRRFSLENKVVL